MTHGAASATLRLTPPFDGRGLLAWLQPRLIAGVEAIRGRTYARIVNLPHGPGVVELTLAADHVAARFDLTDPRDTATATRRSRRLLDLDLDPAVVDAALRQDPVLAPRVAATPGIRLPGQVDGFEAAARAIVGQQVSVAGARTVLGGIARRFGTAVDLPLAREYGLDRAFPVAAGLVDLPADALPMPRGRAAAITAVAWAVGDGSLDLDYDADPVAAREALLAIRGVGPWTADYVRMRAWSDPDVLLDTDLVLRRVLAREGLDRAHADRWRPWRSYASLHLWRTA